MHSLLVTEYHEVVSDREVLLHYAFYCLKLLKMCPDFLYFAASDSVGRGIEAIEQILAIVLLFWQKYGRFLLLFELMIEHKAAKWRCIHSPLVFKVLQRVIAIRHYLFDITTPQIQLSYHLDLHISRTQLPQAKSDLLSEGSSAFQTREEGHFFDL